MNDTDRRQGVWFVLRLFAYVVICVTGLAVVQQFDSPGCIVCAYVLGAIDLGIFLGVVIVAVSIEVYYFRRHRAHERAESDAQARSNWED